MYFKKIKEAYYDIEQLIAGRFLINKDLTTIEHFGIKHISGIVEEDYKLLPVRIFVSNEDFKKFNE